MKRIKVFARKLSLMLMALVLALVMIPSNYVFAEEYSPIRIEGWDPNLPLCPPQEPTSFIVKKQTVNDKAGYFSFYIRAWITNDNDPTYLYNIDFSNQLGAPVEENTFEFILKNNESRKILIFNQCSYHGQSLHYKIWEPDRENWGLLDINGNKDWKELDENNVDPVFMASGTSNVEDATYVFTNEFINYTQKNLSVTLKRHDNIPGNSAEIAIPAPNTGDFTSTTGLDSYIDNLVGGASVLFMLISIACYIIHQEKKNNSTKFLAKVFATTFVVTFIIANIMSFNVFADDTGKTNYNTGMNNALSITVEDFFLELEPTSDGAFAYGKSTIKINRPTDYGYALSAYTTTPDLVHTEDSTQRISSLNSTSSTTLGINTWGFSQSEPQDSISPVWLSLPQTEDTALILKDTYTSTPAEDTTNIYFGTKVNNELALGEYKGGVVYTAVIKPEPLAHLDTGSNINIKMKNLANNITDAEEWTRDTMIATIARADSLPTGFAQSGANTISTSNSAYPVYIFFDDTTGTMYYYTEANDIKMNSDSYHMFSNFRSLANIDALADWNTSSVTNMSYMFSWDSSLTNINALADWDTSKVTDMESMFLGASSLTNINGTRNWNTSSVTNMSGMFEITSSLTIIDALSSWDTSSVTDMTWMFSDSSITNIDALVDWDMSMTINMSAMFYDASFLTNIDGASSWNTSSVASMYQMFYGASSLTNINGARNWNTENVTDIGYMFNSVNNIDATVLNNWNVSNISEKDGAFTCPLDKRPSWY